MRALFLKTGCLFVVRPVTWAVLTGAAAITLAAAAQEKPRLPGQAAAQDKSEAPRERPDARDRKSDEAGFVSLFDGKSLEGWRVNPNTGHSAASGNKSGGKWEVREGAITGCQDTPGNGGILMTEAGFGDFEVAVEMNNDFGPDSGLFLRSTDKGVAYQVHIDYHKDGTLAGLYGEGFSTPLRIRNFKFLDSPERIAPETDRPVTGSPEEKLTPAFPVFPLPVKPEEWPKFWRHGEWNEIRARITGNPPTITTWINGVKWLEYTDHSKRHPERGRIALQVHGGGDYTKQFVRYRNIRVKRLDRK